MTNKFQLASHTQESESLKDIQVSAYRIPTPAPESDGTLRWDHTTMVLVELQAGDKTGIGYTYAHPAAASLIHSVLTPALSGEDVFDIPRLHRKMTRLIRNIGTTGLAMMAVSAVDIALWDVKARLLNLPLVQLLGKARERILIYGSGGFTSYTRKEMQEETEHWLALGLRQVKMKVGRYPADDPCRVQLAREFIGDKASLFVDANGAYDVKQALKMASAFAGYEVEWFEEPVPSSDLPGLRLLRSRIPDGMRIAAGEYGFNPWYFQNMLSSDSVDVLQADATRCGGITGFLAAGQLAHAFQIPFSSHCAPAIHLAAAASLPSFFTAEYFIDHVRIESELLEGTSVPRDGYLAPDETAPGHGLAFRHSDAEQHKIA